MKICQSLFEYVGNLYLSDNALEASVWRIYWHVRPEGRQTRANISSKHRLRGHYHFYPADYLHIQIMIDIFSLKMLFW